PCRTVARSASEDQRVFRSLPRASASGYGRFSSVKTDSATSKSASEDPRLGWQLPVLAPRAAVGFLGASGRNAFVRENRHVPNPFERAELPFCVWLGEHGSSADDE